MVSLIFLLNISCLTSNIPWVLRHKMAYYVFYIRNIHSTVVLLYLFINHVNPETWTLIIYEQQVNYLVQHTANAHQHQSDRVTLRNQVIAVQCPKQFIDKDKLLSIKILINLCTAFYLHFGEIYYISTNTLYLLTRM